MAEPAPKSSFTRFAEWAAWLTGRPISFGVAVLIIAVWSISGPIFHYSDTWQLVINTSTTIVTFLMVFLIQNTQNRDAKAIQIKLDELLRSIKGAHTALLDLENKEEDELDMILANYEKLADQARAALKHGRRDTGTPEVPVEICKAGEVPGKTKAAPKST